ncbi:MAG: RagB/SusD family nutrient uptake outer membrane protein [Tannerella sp.]|jgi:hypothetical protein|nr:RagB/SusD family nutrient uptake outer membrane protein [Tannerella sp.]
MKRLYNAIAVLLIAAMTVTASSCDKELTTGSSVEVTGNDLTSSTVGLDMLLRAAYLNLLFGEGSAGGQETATYVGIPGFNLYYDLSGQDAVVTTNYGMSPEDCYKFAPNRTNAGLYGAKIWRMMYLIINQANAVLAALPEASGNQADKDALEGQCKAIRGICYFHLMLNYQQTYSIAKDKRGVILRTSPEQPLSLGFSTVQQCYEQIVNDLSEAKTKLAGFDRAEKWQINADVAAGYLARVYQVMERWEDALREATAVYNKYNVLMTKEEWCGGHSNIEVPEIIWAVIMTNLSGHGNSQFLYWHNQDPDYGEGMTDGPIYNFLSIFVDQKYVDLFDNTDYRGTKCTKTWKEGDPETNHVTNADTRPVMFWHRTRARIEWRDKWAFNKFKYYGDEPGGIQQPDRSDYSLLRSSEMLLIKAEAEANLNNSNALATLNTLQRLRNARLTTVTDKAPLLEAIYIERRKELLGEGVTGMYDNVRLKKDMIRYGETAGNPAGHFFWGLTNLDPVSENVAKMPSNDYRYFCQIPISEFANNTAINEATDQNPFSGTGN